MTDQAPRIVVLDGNTLNPGDNPWDAVAALGDLVVYDRTPAELIVERAAPADILLTNKTPLDAQRCPASSGCDSSRYLPRAITS
jgi:glycerate dehydrogenase